MDNKLHKGGMKVKIEILRAGCTIASAEGKERKKAFGGGKRDRPSEGEAFIQERRIALDVRPKVGISIPERRIAVPLPGTKEKRATRGRFPPFPLVLKEGGRLDEQQ